MSDVQPDGNLGDMGPEVAEASGASGFPLWMSQLPDDFKKHEGLSEFKTIGHLAEAYLNKEPTEPGAGPDGEGPEDVEGAAEASPIPESPEGYELILPEVPEHLKGPEFSAYRGELKGYIDKTQSEIRELACDLKLTPEAAQRISDYLHGQIFDAVKTGAENQAAERDKGLETLKTDWKGDFEPNIEMCRRTIKTFDDGSLVVDLEAEGGLVNKPSLMKFVFKVSKAMGEGVLVPGSTAPSEPGPADKKEQTLRERYPNSPEMFK